MAMTLKQAFTMWSMAPRNVVLAANSRDAVQKVLMKKWNDVDLEQITESFARRIFLESPEVQELKTKAAAILVYLLQWGGDHGYCQRPTFTSAIAWQEKNTEGHGATDQNATAGSSDGAIQPAPESEKPNPCDGCNNVKGCITCIDGDQRAVITVVEPKQQQDMEEKKPRGKQPKPVVQIDPKTLQVIKEWPSMSEAQKELCLSHVDVAVSKIRKCGGYYWSLAADADTFNERLNAKENIKIIPKPAEKKPKKPAKPKYTHFVRSQEEIFQSARKDDDYASTAANDALTVFTDDEILAELDRRGWQGDLSRTQRITIGRKTDL